jgi:hypothetical protein
MGRRSALARQPAGRAEVPPTRRAERRGQGRRPPAAPPCGGSRGFSNRYVTVNRFLTFCHTSHGIGRLRAGLGSGFSSRSGMGAPQHGLRPIGGQNVRDAICVAAPSKRSRRSTPPACPLTPAVLGAGGGAAGVRLRRRRLPPAGSRRNRGRGRAWRAGSPRASGRGQRAPSCGRPGRRAPRTRL